ncbi:MAG TPA: hypothetical protein DEP35_05055 [Deltaproteobacteria bacterium]|jgi:hypothetical protein|nr:hypothetical protein [Deltaproteobacteria bacterium]
MLDEKIYVADGVIRMIGHFPGDHVPINPNALKRDGISGTRINDLDRLSRRSHDRPQTRAEESQRSDKNGCSSHDHLLSSQNFVL